MSGPARPSRPLPNDTPPIPIERNGERRASGTAGGRRHFRDGEAEGACCCGIFDQGGTGLLGTQVWVLRSYPSLAISEPCLDVDVLTRSVPIVSFHLLGSSIESFGWLTGSFLSLLFFFLFWLHKLSPAFPLAVAISHCFPNSPYQSSFTPLMLCCTCIYLVLDTTAARSPPNSYGLRQCMPSLSESLHMPSITHLLPHHCAQG